MTKLTNKQQAFVDEYLVDLNATQAAIRAGYSENSAMQQGHQLLEKTLVHAAIQENMDKRSAETEITAAQVLEKIKVIAFAGPKSKVTDANKLRGLELLGKHLAMFTERHIVIDERPLKDDTRADIEARMIERMERLGLTGQTRH